MEIPPSHLLLVVVISTRSLLEKKSLIFFLLFLYIKADANHFMLEPVAAEDMAAEIREEARRQRVNEAMGMGMFFGPPRRQRRKEYGRPNAKAGDMYCAADYLMIPGGKDL